MRLPLGEILTALGRLDEAEEHFVVVEAVVRKPRPHDHFMIWRYAERFCHGYGELWLARGDTMKALAHADECLQRSEGNGSRKNIVKGRRLRGQVLLAQGRPLEAEREIEIALQIARQIGNPPQIWKTCAALGAARGARGASVAAREAYRAALATIDRVAAGLTDARVRDTFLTSSHVDHIRRLAGEGESRPIADR